MFRPALLSAVCTSLILVPIAFADLIYDVDFEGPGFIDGQGIPTGPGSDTPSFSTGSPTAVNDASLGSFSSQAGFLNNGGQLKLDAPGAGSYSTGIHWFEFEATMIDAVGANLAEIALHDESEGIGIGVLFNAGNCLVGSLGNLVSLPYVLGTPRLFQFQVNLDTELYSAWVDTSLVLSDIPVVSSFDITEVYANTGLPDPNASMGIDNLYWAIIPEPSTCFLLLSGLMLALSVRRHGAQRNGLSKNGHH